MPNQMETFTGGFEQKEVNDLFICGYESVTAGRR
jgi:hypothetical protein